MSTPVTDHSVQTKYNQVIEPGYAGRNSWSDIWRYRELFYFLSWRDILVRYKQTVVGVAWSVIRPLLAMSIFTIVFGRIAKLPSGDAPYPIMVFAAMLPWQMFAGALSGSSNSVVANSALVSKVYFPRMIIPASAVVVSLVDFLISCAIMSVMMIVYHFVPTWKVVFLPAFLGLAVCTAFGAGLWFSALNVKYRDFQHIVPFIVQFGMYVSPVGFASAVIPEKWQLVYSLNPMVGVIDGFRWAILGGDTKLYLPGLAISVALTSVILGFGIRFFRRTERTFADVI